MADRPAPYKADPDPRLERPALQNRHRAELEEGEDDLNKLAAWLDKIRTRYFFPDDHAKKTQRTLIECQSALRKFADEVYRKEGLRPSKGNRPGLLKFHPNQ